MPALIESANSIKAPSNSNILALTDTHTDTNTQTQTQTHASAQNVHHAPYDDHVQIITVSAFIIMRYFIFSWLHKHTHTQTSSAQTTCDPSCLRDFVRVSVFVCVCVQCSVSRPRFTDYTFCSCNRNCTQVLFARWGKVVCVCVSARECCFL